MIKAMIVDDDINYRFALQNIIDWSAHGITVECEAVHGLQALEYLQENEIDLVLTDMSMPQMNGVELIKSAKALYPSIQILALSGYDDFDFVRNALKAGAHDYILKYELSKEHLSNIITELTERITKIKNTENITFDGVKDDDTIEYMLQSCFAKILSPLQEGELYSRLGGFSLFGSLCVYSEKLDIYTAKSDLSASGIFFFSIKENTFGMLFCSNKIVVSQAKTELLSIAKELTEKPNVTVGISDISTVCSFVKTLFDQSQYALERMMYSGEGELYHFTEFFSEDNEKQLTTITDKLCDRIKNKDFIKSQEVLTELFDTTFSTQPPKNILDQLLAEVYITIMQNNTGGEVEEFKKNLDAKKTLRERQEIITRCLDEYKETITDGEKTYSKKISQVIQYIQKNYHSQITLNDMADTVFLTPGYLSSTFKAETGMRIMQYVNNVRINKATALIETQNLKTYEIALATGFENATYFSTVFKTVTGMTVQEYRAKS